MNRKAFLFDEGIALGKINIKDNFFFSKQSKKNI